MAIRNLHPMVFIGTVAILFMVTIFESKTEAASVTTSIKRGRCPAPSGKLGICIYVPGRNCLMDSHCPGRKKCCSEGCGKVCKNPCHYIKCSRRCKKYAVNKDGCQTCRCEIEEIKEKPGHCPRSSKGHFCRRRRSTCKTDADCLGTKKCCGTRCGKACRLPVRTGYNKCPPGVPIVRCLVNPCKNAKCPAYPKARCIPDYCGGCYTRFYYRGRRVCARNAYYL